MLKVLSKVLFSITLCTIVQSGSISLALAQPSLSIDDCAKCHDEQPAQIEANGASHKSEIDCQACHTGHLPKSSNNIPNCNDCHTGSDHYQVDNCLGCHNPHEPLNVVLTGEHKSVCVFCHSEPDTEMSANPSIHADFACNFCHADTHGNIPECVNCHEPHSTTMTQDNCATCHQAHQPLVLTYPESTGSDLCAACHDSVYSTLTSSYAKHSQVSCVSCHANEHKVVPSCNDCHGQPHVDKIHQRFPNCSDCHYMAHDLNNWPVESK